MLNSQGTGVFLRAGFMVKQPQMVDVSILLRTRITGHFQKIVFAKDNYRDHFLDLICASSLCECNIYFLLLCFGCANKYVPSFHIE